MHLARSSPVRPLAAAALLAMVAAACAPARPPATTPDPAAAIPTPLPPIPRVEGPLRPRVVYPPADALLTARDSNFIFGSLGHGGASLAINGTPVEVAPNGAWIAFLPVPPDGRYELAARVGADSARMVHQVRVPAAPVPLPAIAPLELGDAVLTPRATRWPADDPLRVSVRAPANAAVFLALAGGRRHPLVPSRGEQWATELSARDLAPGPQLVAIRGADTVRLTLPAVDTLAPGIRTWVQLGDPTADAGDERIVGRPLPGGTYKWFFVPGTVAELTGHAGDQARIRLADGLQVWVPGEVVRELPPGTPSPRRSIGGATLAQHPAWVELRLPMAERPPYLVEQEERALALTLYQTTGNLDRVNFAGSDSLVRDLTWQVVPGDAVRITLHLAHAPYGYLALWEEGRFVLRVRRRPAVDTAQPLRGLRIVVDAGHPPAGATGPTGLTEAEAVLAISLHLRDELERRGAAVIMTRATMDPVALVERPIMARRADGHALVSIHLNALPDGVNPFVSHGTSTYYFHPQSAKLARAVQRGMLASMGLRDLGVFLGNLALVRGTWMPSVLAEGAFMMIPAQEAAMRTPEFQAAYARGVADGLQAYFRGLAEER